MPAPAPPELGSRIATSPSHHAQTVLVLMLAWGAFAFGAVYPWGFWPLAILGVTATALTLIGAPAEVRASGLRPIAASLGAVVVAGLLQILPMPVAAIRVLSPHTVEVLPNLDPSLDARLPPRHSLSMDPAATLTGLALLGAFSLLALGSARLTSRRGASGLSHAITIVGAVLAVTGIIHQPLFNGRIYGFWTPLEGGLSYGPFVNKNHFAGWMLMAVPLTLGLVLGGLHRVGTAGRTWRERLVLLSSPHASRLILLSCAALLMAMSLVLTMSRSGISALALSIVLTALAVIRRHRSAGRRALGITYLVVLFVCVIGWVGANTVITRFARADWRGLDGRFDAWTDAIGVIARFPITGTGLNTYGVATLLVPRRDPGVRFTQAHNDYLQFMAEGGSLMAIPALVSIIALVQTVRRRFDEEVSTSTYWLRVGACTGLAAMALQESVEFSLQMPGNTALFAVLCGIALHRTPEWKVRHVTQAPL